MAKNGYWGKNTYKEEKRRLYAILGEMDPLSDEYGRVLSRLDKLEETHARNGLNRLSVNNVVGNVTTGLCSLAAYWHEDIWNKLPTRGLAKTFLPKSTTKR